MGPTTQASRRRAPAVLLLFLTALFGCAEGDPECSCTPRNLELVDVPIGGRAGGDFTVSNTGDGGRLSWFIDLRDQAPLGLSILDESALYVLEEGQEASFTLGFSPTQEVPDTSVTIRVGLDDCLLDVRLSAREFEPECTVTDTLVEFATAVGDTSTHDVYLVNTGGGTVRGTIFPSGCGFPFVVETENPSYALGPGDSTLVRVSYTPFLATEEGVPDECLIDLGNACGSIDVRGTATGTLGGPAAADADPQR